MKKTIFLAFIATSLFACQQNEAKVETTTSTSTSSCVKEGPEVDLMNKAVTAYANGDWTTLATYFSDTAVSYHNNDTAAMKMSDRIELFKKQRENIDGSVDAGTPNFEVVTVPSNDPAYEGIKWGHAWVRFKFKPKGAEPKSSLTFASFAIKGDKIIWEQVIYDSK
jgi:hypothetical protein